MNEQFDAIVVGAGFGGATCAALLSQRGLRTLLVDKNAAPGGKAMTDAAGVKEGDEIRARLSKGELLANVTKVVKE